MALRTIRIAGDPVLGKPCREVIEITPKIRELIGDMFDTMYDAAGVGLAAPQVGILRRIVVIDCGEETGGPYVLINPVITLAEGEQTGDEGCLSLPGKVGTVRRPEHVIVEAKNENMETITVEGRGLLARAICHECDHLEGHMYMELAEPGSLRDMTFEEDEEDEEGGE